MLYTRPLLRVGRGALDRLGQWAGAGAVIAWPSWLAMWWMAPAAGPLMLVRIAAGLLAGACTATLLLIAVEARHRRREKESFLREEAERKAARLAEQLSDLDGGHLRGASSGASGSNP